MKKTVSTLFATLCLAACVQEDIDTSQQYEEITFGTEFTAYVTKNGEVTQENLREFYVFGWRTNDPTELPTQIFGNDDEGTRVYMDDDGNWVHDDEKQYWLPGYTYQFWAITRQTDNHADDFEPLKDGTGENIIPNEFGMPQYYSLSLSGSDGLPWGDSNATSNKPDYTIASTGRMQSSEGPVVLDFKHVLSKVRMSFTNNIDPYVNIDISNITITCIKAGNLRLDDNPEWSSSGSLSENSFNDVDGIGPDEEGETAPIFLIPSKDTRTISFDATLRMDGVDNPLYTKTIVGTIQDQILDMGAAYKFSAIITPESIETGRTSFEVEQMPDWDTPKDENSDVGFDDAERIMIASKLGGEVTLTGDVEITGTIDVTDNLTVNLNGYTLTYTGTGNEMFSVMEAAVLTINPTDSDGNYMETSSVVSTTGALLATANSGSSIIINGGSHKTNGTATYSNNGGSITIHSGSFYKWDPSNGDVTYTDPHNFLAKPDTDLTEKLFVIKDEDWYIVNKEFTIAGDNAINDFQNAINDRDVTIINAGCDIDYNEMFTLNDCGDVTLNMYDYTFQGNRTWYSGIVTEYTKLTVNGGNFMGGFQVAYSGSELTLNNCNIKVTAATTSGRYCVYAVANAVIKVNGGKFELNLDDYKNRSYFYAASGAVIYIYDCECGPASTNTNYPPLYEGDGGEIIVYGGTFGFNPTDWVADGYEAVQNGSTWTVQPVE